MKLLFLSLFLLVGCDDKPSKAQLELEESQRKFEARSADAASRKCTKKQLELVQAEFKVCTETQYTDIYCFDVAKITHCNKKIQ